MSGVWSNCPHCFWVNPHGQCDAERRAHFEVRHPREKYDR